MAQGLTLGGVISGIRVSGGQFAGGPFDWLNPFSIAVGLALVAGYILLGSTYLLIKTEGPVQERAYGQALWSAWVVLAFQSLITFWTPLHYPAVWTLWFTLPRIAFIWAFPVLGLAAFALLIRSLKARREIVPFFCSIAFFLAGYLGLAASLYPFAIPPSVTFHQAAAQRETLEFTLWGVAIVLPAVLGYIIYTYSVFRGKVGEDALYH